MWLLRWFHRFFLCFECWCLHHLLMSFVLVFVDLIHKVCDLFLENFIRDVGTILQRRFSGTVLLAAYHVKIVFLTTFFLKIVIIVGSVPTASWCHRSFVIHLEYDILLLSLASLHYASVREGFLPLLEWWVFLQILNVVLINGPNRWNIHLEKVVLPIVRCQLLEVIYVLFKVLSTPCHQVLLELLFLASRIVLFDWTLVGGLCLKITLGQKRLLKDLLTACFVFDCCILSLDFHSDIIYSEELGANLKLLNIFKSNSIYNIIWLIVPLI